MQTLPDLFPGFASRRIFTQRRRRSFARIGGNGPPLFLLHGYPQTHVHLAPGRAASCGRFQLIIPDLRGYGASSVPPADNEHYSLFQARHGAGHHRHRRSARLRPLPPLRP